MPYTLSRNEGWNAGARSKKICAADCQLQFSVPESNTGLCIGLNTTDTTVSFREIKHGLFLTLTAGGPQAYVYESGVQKFSAGPYVTADRFTIRRNGTVVKYLKNNELFYTSDVPSVGPVFVDTSLYAAGDRV